MMYYHCNCQSADEHAISGCDKRIAAERDLDAREQAEREHWREMLVRAKEYDEMAQARESNEHWRDPLVSDGQPFFYHCNCQSADEHAISGYDRRRQAFDRLRQS